jgi:hypothetical protein
MEKQVSGMELQMMYGSASDWFPDKFSTGTSNQIQQDEGQLSILKLKDFGSRRKKDHHGGRWKKQEREVGTSK